MLVGVALWEDRVVTKVESGENAGKTLTDRFAVRKYAFQKTTLSSSRSASNTFPLELGPGWDASKCGVAVFVQNWDDGRVQQADSVAWPVGVKKGNDRSGE
jgi:hypothetical protein